MLIQMGNVNQVEATADVKKQMQSHARSFSTGDVLRMMKAFNSAATDLRGGWQPSLGLELALAEVLDAPNEPAPRPSTPPPAASARPQPQPSPERTPQTAPPHRENRPAPSSQTASSQLSSQTGKVSGDETEAVKDVEATAPHTSEKSTVSAGDIIKAWKHLSASLPKAQANLSALLNSVRMIDVQGKTLILGLASDVLVSKIDKPDQIEAIKKLIQDEFGVEMNVRCVVTTAKGKIPPNVPQDGMVAAAIQQGGQIVDME
jgi:DNA polymerase III gamma/tau subunit